MAASQEDAPDGDPQIKIEPTVGYENGNRGKTDPGRASTTAGLLDAEQEDRTEQKPMSSAPIRLGRRQWRRFKPARQGKFVGPGPVPQIFENPDHRGRGRQARIEFCRDARPRLPRFLLAAFPNQFAKPAGMFPVKGFFDGLRHRIARCKIKEHAGPCNGLEQGPMKPQCCTEDQHGKNGGKPLQSVANLRFVWRSVKPSKPSTTLRSLLRAPLRIFQEG